MFCEFVYEVRDRCLANCINIILIYCVMIWNRTKTMLVYYTCQIHYEDIKPSVNNKQLTVERTEMLPWYWVL